MNPKRFTFESKSIAITGLSFNETLEVKIRDTEAIIDGFVFRLQGAISGCGLCVVKLFNGINEPQHITKKMVEEKDKGQMAKSYGQALIEFVSSGNVRTGTDKKGCILATLGTYYLTPNYKCLDFILDMGFKEILEFDNLAHNHNNDKQKIFALTIKR